MSSSLLEEVSSGPKTRKFVMFNFMTSRKNSPSGRVFSACTTRASRVCTRTRGSPATAALSSPGRRWHGDWSPCAVLPDGRQSLEFGAQASILSNSSSGFSRASSFPVAQVLRDFSLHRDRDLVRAPEPFQFVAVHNSPEPSTLSASAKQSWATAAARLRRFARASC